MFICPAARLPNRANLRFAYSAAFLLLPDRIPMAEIAAFFFRRRSSTAWNLALTPCPLVFLSISTFCSCPCHLLLSSISASLPASIYLAVLTICSEMPHCPLLKKYCIRISVDCAPYLLERADVYLLPVKNKPRPVRTGLPFNIRVLYFWISSTSNSGIPISSHLIAASRSLPFSVSEKYIWRLSSVPSSRTTRPFRSTERNTFEVLEGESPSSSPNSPEDSFPAPERLQSAIPSFRQRPWVRSKSVSNRFTARCRSRILHSFSILVALVYRLLAAMPNAHAAFDTFFGIDCR